MLETAAKSMIEVDTNLGRTSALGLYFLNLAIKLA